MPDALLRKMAVPAAGSYAVGLQSMSAAGFSDGVMLGAEFSQCNELLFVSASLTLVRSSRPPCYA